SFKTKEIKLRKGDFTYGVKQDDQFDPFAWLGKEDVDNSKYQLKKETTTMLLTAIGHATTTQEHNVDICERVFKLIKMTCPDATMELCYPEFFDETKS
ncbi:MAG: hypothetical protein JSR46_09480, partial [Verrucomicrobia bacterium]|nr:hypothetical protein [Verrucomicrobiota bacterium]